MGVTPQVFAEQVKYEIEQGSIRPVNPYHLIVNMLALCIFPFVAEPIVKNVIFGNDPEMYNQFIESRKNEVPKFIINSIKKNE